MPRLHNIVVRGDRASGAALALRLSMRMSWPRGPLVDLFLIGPGLGCVLTARVLVVLPVVVLVVVPTVSVEPAGAV